MEFWARLKIFLCGFFTNIFLEPASAAFGHLTRGRSRAKPTRAFFWKNNFWEKNLENTCWTRIEKQRKKCKETLSLEVVHFISNVQGMPRLSKNLQMFTISRENFRNISISWICFFFFGSLRHFHRFMTIKNFTLNCPAFLEQEHCPPWRELFFWKNDFFFFEKRIRKIRVGHIFIHRKKHRKKHMDKL